ncbi:MAG: cell division topological specificity factor MinE [Synechococcaceae cyanobacterium RL_1_2]|nr:cell division topological specificity factor MinE [Synechococcaceae cyanobacterium RL_1_2]
MFNELFKMLPWAQSAPSKDDAKRRLKVIIAHDRVGLTPEVMELMREEILAVIARYVEIDVDDMEFCLENENRLTALTANFPIKRINLEGLPTEPIQSGQMDTQLEDSSNPAQVPNTAVNPVSPPEIEAEATQIEVPRGVNPPREDQGGERVSESTTEETLPPTSEVKIETLDDEGLK